MSKGITVAESDKRINGFEKWEVEGFARTLAEAEEIMADKKKLKAVKQIAEKQADAAEAVEKKVAERLKKLKGS